MIKEEIDLLLTKEKGIGYHECPAGFIIKQFDGDDRVAIIRLLDSNVISTVVIEYLSSKGLSLNPAQLNKHRRRTKGTGCACAVEL